MASHDSRRFWLILSLVLVVAFALVPTLASAQGTGTAGAYYVVQRGDSWSEIAWRNDLTLSQLRAANPQYIRPDDVLWPGDRLFIPLPRAAAQATNPSGPGSWYTARRGDTWQTIARDAGVTVLDLYHANPGLASQAGSPPAGTRLWIPAASPETPTATVTSAAGAEAATEAQPAPTPTAIFAPGTEAPTEAQPAPIATVTSVPETEAAPAETQPAPTPTAAPPPTPTAAAATTNSSNCPGQYRDYPDAITDYLNSANATAEGLRIWLAGCRAITAQQGSVTEASIQGPASDDYLVVLADPNDTQPNPPNRLLVYHGLPTGSVLAGIAQGEGKIAVLRAADINADGNTDVVWTDTTCAGESCQSTLFVDSWDGSAYRSFIEGQPVTPSAEYSFQPIPGFASQAIVIRSGVTGGSQAPSVAYVPATGGLYRPLPGAALSALVGPTSSGTAATVTPVPTAATGTQTAVPAASAASPAGPTAAATGGPTPAPTAAAQAAGACLFDQIKSADQSFDAWPSAGFSPAIAAYQAALDDTGSIACGNITDELAVLRDFVRFRLMVALSGNGKISQAPAIRDQITTPALKAAAEAFLKSYQDSHSLLQACRDTSTYAAAHPESWRFMVDLGDKTFTADDLCPLAK